VPSLPENHHLRVLPTSASNSLKQYNRCAVVGSSAILLSEVNKRQQHQRHFMFLNDFIQDSSHGASIDAADMVMRFNWPPLRGFERDVGRSAPIS
jgi:hypothetical protein